MALKPMFPKVKAKNVVPVLAGYIGKTELKCSCGAFKTIDSAIPSIVIIIMNNAGWTQQGDQTLCPNCSSKKKEAPVG